MDVTILQYKPEGDFIKMCRTRLDVMRESRRAFCLPPTNNTKCPPAQKSEADYII